MQLYPFAGHAAPKAGDSTAAPAAPVASDSRSVRPTGKPPPARCRTPTPITATSVRRSNRWSSADRPRWPADRGSRVDHSGKPIATVNKINIVGNDVTHERVIRSAIVLLPGAVFSKDLLIRSYQNVGNLGYFQQPMAPPSWSRCRAARTWTSSFRVEEKRTGNINFGASLGQGTGVGGFLGLEEPNLFGRGKRGRLQWQFGTNINDFTLSYSDPAIRESRMSGTAGDLRFPRSAIRSTTSASAGRSAAASSSDFRSSGHATPASSAPTDFNASATPKAPRISRELRLQQLHAARRWAPPRSGTPGSASRSPPADRNVRDG